MKQLQRALIYIFSVTVTAFSFALLYPLISAIFDHFVAFKTVSIELILANAITSFIVCWIAAFLWALSPFFILNACKKPISENLIFHLLLASVFSLAASVFHSVYAPDAPPNQSLLAVVLNNGFAIFASSVVASALIGAWVYWMILRYGSPGR